MLNGGKLKSYEDPIFLAKSVAFSKRVQAQE
jgi:hypothetical protein